MQGKKIGTVALIFRSPGFCDPCIVPSASKAGNKTSLFCRPSGTKWRASQALHRNIEPGTSLPASHCAPHSWITAGCYSAVWSTVWSWQWRSWFYIPMKGLGSTSLSPRGPAKQTSFVSSFTGWWNYTWVTKAWTAENQCDCPYFFTLHLKYTFFSWHITINLIPLSGLGTTVGISNCHAYLKSKQHCVKKSPS